MVESPLISIIVTTHLRERFRDLVEMLDSIRNQSYPNLEVVVVIDGAAELFEWVKAHLAEGSGDRVQVLHNTGDSGAAAARNLGIAHSTGEVIAFVDDDAVLFPDWAAAVARACAGDDSVIGVTGPIIPLWEQESMNWFPREFYWVFSCTYWDEAEPKEVRNGYGTNLAFKKEAFAAAGLLNGSLGIQGQVKHGWNQPGAEETDFSIRVRRSTGKRIVYYPDIRVRHKVYGYRLAPRFVARRAYWEGYAKAMLKGWYSASDAAVLSTEFDLLRRILLRLVPGALGRLFRRPLMALRQLGVIIIVISCVAAGYARYTLFQPLRRKRHHALD